MMMVIMWGLHSTFYSIFTEGIVFISILFVEYQNKKGIFIIKTIKKHGRIF